jgi:hypothetical protein
MGLPVMTRRTASAVVMLTMTLPLCACDAGNDSAPAAAATAPVPSRPSSSASASDVPQSSLGAAKRSAEDTVKKAETTHQKAIDELTDP